MGIDGPINETQAQDITAIYTWYAPAEHDQRDTGYVEN